MPEANLPTAKGLQFTARVGQLPADLFVVVGFEFTEALSQLFKGELKLASTDPGIGVGEVLEQPVELAIWQDGQLLRRFTGVVSEFARGDTGHRRTRYELVVEPALWRLGLMHNSRIFQTQTPDAILKTLLDERGIADTVFDLKRTPQEREYCVQHRESDLAFLQRLAAEEGWHFRFEIDGRFDIDSDNQPLVLSDHHGDAPILPEATYNASAGGSSRQPAVLAFSYRERVRAASVAMKDYTFKNPAYALMHEQAASGIDHQLDDYQYYDYPGRFKADASGTAFTQARLDALRNDASEAQGKSNRPDLAAGAKLPLTGHQQDALNRDWLLTGIVHTGKQPQALEEEGGSEPTSYSNTFTAIPADRTWRPQVTHRPLMDGPQMAIVTGPAGEEIHCDEHGRVKVRFPWDRYSDNDEHSSAWLRVSQGWAGGQYGFLALPRIGHEVIVSFLDGDPDQPIITGRTYHATNTPPYALPEHKTRTVLKTQTHKGEGSNELRFEDEAGQEQIYVHAQKDLDLLTENDRTEVIKHDSHLTVENDRVGHIQANDHLTVDGEQRTKIGGDYSLTVNGNHHSHQGQSQLIEAGNEIHHKAGMKVVIEAGAEVTLTAGGSFIKVDPSGVTVSGPMVKMNSGGSPGSGTGASAQAPNQPGVLADQEQPDNASAQLADAGVRENGVADTALSPSVSSTSARGSEAGVVAGISALTAEVLARVAKAGSTFFSGCEFDSSGRCVIHEHDQEAFGLQSSEPTALLGKVSKQGAPITEEQLALASAGEFLKFWRSRHLSGDPVARTALTGWGDPDFVGASRMQRMAAEHTWSDLSDYIADNGLTVSMEQIGIELAKAHAFAVMNDTQGVANLLSPQQVADYHHDVFAKHGIPPHIFGGTHRVPLVYVPTPGGWEPVMFDADSYSDMWCEGCDSTSKEGVD